MIFTACELPGLIVCEPVIFGDSRGHFFEAYNQMLFQKNGIDLNFVQDNQSRSSHGVIRGLHYQLNPFAQAKLVRVLEGTILDVVVDIRTGSPTFGKHCGLELSAENKKQLFIPAGFAHGFSVLTESATVLYKCDQFYNKQSEGGIRFDDPTLNIDWKIDLSHAVIYPKDLELPYLKDCNTNFQY